MAKPGLTQKLNWIFSLTQYLFLNIYIYVHPTRQFFPLFSILVIKKYVVIVPANLVFYSSSNSLEIDERAPFS